MSITVIALDLELMAGMKLTEKLKWDVNVTLSKNKIKDFTDYVDEYGT